MRRTTRLLPLALALLAAHATLAAPPEPALSWPSSRRARSPSTSPTSRRATRSSGSTRFDRIAVTVSNYGGDLIFGEAALDAAVYSHSTGPEGELTIAFDRPVYGVAFLFGAPFSGDDAIGVNTDPADPNWFLFPTFTVGTLHGTPGGRVSILATDGASISNVSAESGFIGGIFNLRILARPVAVPEPSTLALAGIGGLALVGYGWRRRKRTVA